MPLIYEEGALRRNRMPRLSRRARWIVIAVLAVVGVEVALQTWWLPAKWHTYDAAATGRMLVGPDGRTITLTVEWQCEQEPDLIARESGDRVDVLLHRKGFMGPTYQCPEGGTARISTRLRAPLASRPLVDGVTGQPVVHFDGRELATPSYLPPEYDHPDEDPVPYLPGLASPPANVPSWTVGFQHGAQSRSGPRLLITQTRGGEPPAQGEPQASVNGHPAAFVSGSPASGPRSVIWSDGTYTYAVSSGRPASLTDGELLRVAEGLHQG
ncbi:hypothetical protein ACIGZJ_17715 [Kitasatospora sp. NPDC052868]|uniref:hypothetical protein n=1 Tax=Kitasatospora sp. NPDC052868 TaxID=3364060 RepID=UPI0037C7F908